MRYHAGNPRPIPPDFASVFIQLGWAEIEMHYEVSHPAIKRWMRQVGERDLIERRRGYLRKLYASRGRPSIMGRRCGLRHGGFPEASKNDPALAWVPVHRGRRPFRGRLSAVLEPVGY